MPGFEVLLAGRTLADRYRVDAVIGRGAMGAVFRAMDLRLDRAVAVKVVTVEDDLAGEARVRFRREAQAAARIRHPHVVAVHDFGTDAALGLDFLVMELLEGDDLAARLALGGPLAPDDVAAVFRQTAAGLEAGHLMGLVHRDVKPGNVFLKQGRGVNAVLLDFGVAQMELDEAATRTHLTRLGRHPLSPAYASPEQIRGDGPLTPASDVFSLGMTVYTAATGSAPYTPTELEQLAVGVPVPLPVIPPGLAPTTEAALVRALDPDPAARPADAGELLALIEGRTVAPRPVVAPKPAPKMDAAPAVVVAPKARRAGLERAGLLGLGVVAVGVTWMLAGRPGTQPAAPVAIDSAVVAPVDSAPVDTPAAPVVERPPPEPVDSTPAPPVETPPSDGILTLAEVDVQPELENRNEVRRALERNYPPILRDGGVPGTVVLRLVIDEDGRVDEDDVEVVSADHQAFADAALRVASRLRFRPARLGGEPVRVRADIPIQFTPGS